MVSFRKLKKIWKAAVTSIALLLIFGFLGIATARFFSEKLCLRSARQAINTLSPKERESLSSLFSFLVTKEGFGYTLFGTKPISLSHCYDLEKCLDDHVTFLKEHNLIQFHQEINEGWKVWQKYQHLFPSKSFCLRRIGDLGQEDLFILIINKKCFLEAVNDNLFLFQSVLTPSLTSHQLLQQFLTSDFPKRDVLKNHTGLVGILFGFGKQNAFLVHRKTEIEKRISPERYDPVLLMNLEEMPPSKGFRSLEEEDRYLEEKLGYISDDDVELLPLPAFLADTTSEETQALAEKYRFQRTIISSILKRDDFLERVIYQFLTK